MASSTKKIPVPDSKLNHLETLRPTMLELEQKLRSSTIDYSPDQIAAGWSLVQSYQRAINLL